MKLMNYWENQKGFRSELMKKIFIEVACIIIFAGIIGIAYNFFQRSPLTLFRKSHKDTVNIDVLMSEKPKLIDSTKQKLSFSYPEKATSEIKVKQDLKKDSIINNQKKVKKEDILKLLEKTVTYEQLIKLLNDTRIQFVDARTAEDYSKGHIGNAVNIYAYDEDNIKIEKIRHLPTDKVIICYCDGGKCESSKMIAELMIMIGFEKVVLYEGGWEEWAKRQLRNGK